MSREVIQVRECRGEREERWRKGGTNEGYVVNGEVYFSERERERGER